MKVFIFSLALMIFLVAISRSAPDPAPAAAPPQVTEYTVSPPPQPAREELERRLHQIEFFEKYPALFKVPESERRTVLETLKEAKRDFTEKKYTAAWRKLTGGACQTFAQLSVTTYGDIQYAKNSFAEFGVFQREQLLLTGMNLTVTVRHAPEAIAYYGSERSPEWAPLFLGETREPACAGFNWGQFLRYKSFPFSMKTSVDAQGVLWRFRCSSTPNALLRPGWKNWFSLSFRGVSESLWNCPITIVSLRDERKDLQVPALSSSDPWRVRFEKTAAIIFHRPEGDISLSIKPENAQAPGFSGLTVTADKTKKEWEFQVGWEIPANADPQEYRADFDLYLQIFIKPQ